MKAILFDFWGTLVENGVWSPVKQVKDMLHITVPFSEYVVRMERAMMTEKFPTLRDAFLQVFQEFHIEKDEEVLQELVGMWNKSWMLAQPYEETAEVLKRLQEKYLLLLLSNSDCFSVKNVLDKFKLQPYFTKIFLSYEIGLLKTDKSFMKVVLDDVRLLVEDCVLVGDSLQSDIAAAQKIGMDAILVDRKNTRPFEKKIKSLRELEEVLV